jgi:nucleotide-binding universal stress UspA family protein
MSTSTLVEGLAGPTTDESVGLGPILVATDGTSSSDGALKAAAQLAEHANAQVVALSVMDLSPVVAADYGVLLLPPDDEGARRSALFERVKQQIAEVSRDPTGWTIEVRDGDPAKVIARTAHELRARVVIVGLGHHDLLDRLFGSETALHTLRSCKRPVFAVAPSYDHLPTRAIVATDFSVASVRAARASLELLDTISMVYLAHVAPRLELQPEAFAAWMSLYGEGVTPAFERVKAELGLPARVTVEPITLQGKPSREVLEFARSSKIDVIITGSRGAGLIDRMLVGSTATGLIRGAQCSVMAVPTLPGTERPIGLPESARVSIKEEQWAAELAGFTRRNAGRRASLEVDDPEMGAQAQEHDYPFLGVAYDHNDRQVEIMLGDFVGVGRHLTRGIGHIHSIDVLRDESGRDWILRISHGDGQTILTLAR